MPLEIVCSGCGNVLYTGFELRSPKDVIRARENKCSECGKTLSSSEFTIEVLKV
jgi:ribosomal protein S27E